MPREGWYTVAEASQRTGVSYWQAIRWAQQQARTPVRPVWLKKTTKGYFIRTEGVQLLAHAKAK